MLNLDTLSFKVDTSELNDAVSKLESLKNKINQVNTELINANKLETDAKRQSIRVAKEAAVAEQAVEQAKLKTAKATADLEAAEKKAANAGQATVRVQKEVSEEAKKAVSVLERQQMILEFMAQGFSKGQASTMAYAKASGALADELKDLENVLKTQRTLMGTDPFDKSIGALQSIRNEYKVLTDVQETYNQNLGLTRKQMTDLARDKIRLAEQYKIEGKNIQQLDEGLKELTNTYVSIAKAENNIVASMNKADKATTDAGRANAYLDKELEKVRFAMQEVNQELNRGSANSLVRFQNALKASGKTVEEQKILLDEYRASVEKLQTKTQKANSDYIVRAVAPQMTDIFVGLATGQSPLTILLQQGGQLGDQFTQAGVKAQDMSGVMIKSLANVGDTIKGVGVAIGTVLVKGFTMAADAVGNFTLSITGLKALMDGALGSVEAKLGADSKLFQGLKSAVGIITRVAGGTLFTGLTAGLVIYISALKDVIQEETALAKQMALTGGAFGLNMDKVYALSNANATLAQNIGKSVDAFIAISKESSLVGQDITKVAESAINMQKAFGIASDKTVEAFAKIADAPAKGLLELAISTGKVSLETVKLAEELEKQGKKGEAAALAIKELARVNGESAKQVQKDYGTLMTGLMSVKNFFSDLWDTILGIGRKGSLKDQIEKAKKSFQDLQGQVDKSLNVRLGKGPTNAQQAMLDAARANVEALQEELKLQERTLANQQKQAEAAKKYSDTADQRKQAAEDAKKRQKEEYDAAMKIAKERQKARNEELEGADKALAEYEKKELASAMKIALARQKAKADEHEQIRKYFIEQEDLAAKAAKKASEEWNKQYEKRNKEVEQFDNAMDSIRVKQAEERELLAASNAELEAKLGIVGLNKSQQEGYLKQLDKEAQLTELAVKHRKELAEIDKLKKLKFYSDQEAQDAIDEQNRLYEESRKQVDKKIAVNAALEYQKEFDRIKDVIGDALFLALTGKGAEAGKVLRDEIKAQLMKPIRVLIDALVNPIMQAGAAMLGLSPGGVAGQAAGSAISSFAGSAGTSMIGSLFPEATLFGKQIASGFSTTVSSWFGGTASQTAAFADVGMTAAASTSGGSSIGAMAANPYVIAAAIVVALLAGGAFEGETRSGSEYQVQNGSLTRVQGPSGGAINQRNETLLVQQTVKTINNMFKTIGSKTTLSSFVSGLETSEKGRGGVYAGGVLSTGQAFGQTRDTRVGASLNAEDAFKAFGKEQTQSILQALQVAQDIPESIKKLVQGIDIEKLVDEDLNALYDTVQTQVNAVGEFREAMLELPFEQLKDMSYDAAAGLIEAAGGLQQLGTLLGGFYSNYFSEAEQAQMAFDRALGIAQSYGLNINPEDAAKVTRQDVKAFIQSVSPESIGNKAYVDLLKIADLMDRKFDLAEQGAQDAVQAEKELATVRDDSYEKVLNDNKSLQDKLNSLTKSRVELLAAERAQLAPGNAELFDRVTMLELEKEYLSALKNLQSALNGAIDDLISGIEAIEAVATQAAEYMIQTRSELRDAGTALLDYQYDKQQELLALQRQAYQELKQFSDQISDYLDTLNMTASGGSPSDRMTYARDRFASISEAAMSGDVEAQGKLIESAKSYLEASKAYSSSVVDYRRDEAKVRIALEAAKKAATDEMKKLPEEVSTQSTAEKIKAVTTELDLLDPAIELMRLDLASFGITAERSKDQLETLTDAYFTAQGKMREAKEVLQPIIDSMPVFLKSEATKISEAFNKANSDFAKDLGLFVDDLSEIPDDLKNIFTGPDGVLKSFGEILNGGEDSLSGQIKKVFNEYQTGAKTLGESTTTLKSILGKYKTETDTALTTAINDYKTASANLVGYSEKFSLDISKYTSDLASVLAKLNSLEVKVNVSVSGGSGGSSVVTPPPAPVSPVSPVTGQTPIISDVGPTAPSAPVSPVSPVTGQTPIISDVGPRVGYDTSELAVGARQAIDAWMSGELSYSQATFGLIRAAQNLGVDSEQTAAAIRIAYNQANPNGGIMLTAQQVSDYAVAIGLPAFAEGTNFVPQDMIAQIHKGEAIVPAEYNPFNSSFSDDAEVKELLTEVLAELREAKSENRAVAAKSLKYQRETATILDKFDAIGMPATRP